MKCIVYESQIIDIKIRSRIVKDIRGRDKHLLSMKRRIFYSND